MEDKGYKITELSIYKVRNILQAHFEFTGDVIKISGENGAGKSTTVDCIWLGIVGKTYLGTGRAANNLITRGEDKASIEVTLQSSGRTLKIKRSITKEGNVSLKIESSDGAKLLQADLDALLSEFTIDPLEFQRKTKKEQYETIKKLVGLDTDEIDDKISIQLTKSQNARALKTEHKKTLDNLGVPEKVAEIDTTDIVNQINEIQKHNEAIKNGDLRLTTADNAISIVNKEIEELEEKLSKAKAKKKLYVETRAEVSKAVEALGKEKSTLELTEKLNSAKENNKKAYERTRYKDVQTKAREYEAALEKEEGALEKLRDEKKDMIKNSKMPVKGMTFDDAEGLLIDGQPLDQFSSAQQLFIACKIATASNPDLKVIHIKDGSLLDKKTLEEVAKMANKEGYQIFIERVGEEFDSIVMRDGKDVSSDKKGEDE